ncbi:MAG: DUF427 domain-containing protein [Kangiellaceae bacterium]|jgi:uncharacterized protein (DUF427 family)|nr:DUF427 domain-containing protein [Kangiellaceae bacterium]
MKAIWNDAVIAESDQTIVVESNHYFPMSSVNKDYLVDSATTTVCSWKGIANYYSIRVSGEVNKDAVWYYADPKPEAQNIKQHVAFWRGVVVTE